VTFVIDAENNITAFANKHEAGEGESFSTQDELAGLAANWLAARMVEVWNCVPGLTPVKKFKDRKSAVARIWKAIQSLEGGSAAETVTTAPERARKPTAGAKQAKKAKGSSEVPARSANGRKAAAKPPVAREGSKKAEVVNLLQRKGGATLTEIMKTTKRTPARRRPGARTRAPESGVPANRKLIRAVFRKITPL
jgi:hypothetical protein